MNTHELPMIVFTVAAQMSVGAFVVLGIVQLVAGRRSAAATVEKMTDTALYAIGPVMVAGLVASMFHMGDPMNSLNVIRHVGSSWLSREIVFGVGFAGLGFLFALAQWFKWGSARARQALAVVTAAVGLCLVLVMSMVYVTLETVPAWATWATPAQFFTTTFLLGSLAVGAAFMGSIMWRRRATVKANEANQAGADLDQDTAALLTRSLKGVGLTAVAMLGAEFLIIPLHISNLSAAGGVAAQSAEVFSGVWFVARLVLVFAGAGLLALFLYRYASLAKGAGVKALAVMATSAFVLVLAGELIGRAQFYEQMTRIGM